MENHSNQPTQNVSEKQAPKNISADTEANAKEKTTPLDKERAGDDKEEGSMNNGELGGGLGK